MLPVLAALLLQATPALENDFVRVSRNAAPCAKASAGCGARVIVALGDVTFRSASSAVTLKRGDISVFEAEETYEAPVGTYFEVAIKPNHPPATQPQAVIKPDGNVERYSGRDFVVFEERLAVGDTRPRHSHSERVVIQLNRTRLRQKPDGEPEVIREIIPDNAGFNQPVIHTAVNVGELPLWGIVIEFKPPAQREQQQPRNRALWVAGSLSLGGIAIDKNSSVLGTGSELAAGITLKRRWDGGLRFQSWKEAEDGPPWRSWTLKAFVSYRPSSNVALTGGIGHARVWDPDSTASVYATMLSTGVELFYPLYRSVHLRPYIARDWTLAKSSVQGSVVFGALHQTHAGVGLLLMIQEEG